MRHDVMQQGTESCLNAVLGVHGVLDVAELVQQVEGFAPGDGFALEERMADGNVQYPADRTS